jgi:hypothetical protein
MNRSRLLLALSPALLLTACGGAKSADLQTLLENPLYAEQFYDAQVENMVNLILSSGALLKDPATKKAIDDTRVEGLSHAKEATTLQARGKLGVIVSDTEEAAGEALLLDGVLYTGPEFQMLPGGDVRVYVSTVLDPRDGVFPDDTATEIDRVHTPFGASSYNVQLSGDELDAVRTVVFYDRELKRIVGFAQLQERQ